MAEAARSPRQSRWPWAVAIVLLLIVDALTLGISSGECVDYVDGGPQSYCTSGPAIGVPAAWVIGIVSILGLAYFGYRLLRPRPV